MGFRRRAASGQGDEAFWREAFEIFDNYQKSVLSTCAIPAVGPRPADCNSVLLHSKSGKCHTPLMKFMIDAFSAEDRADFCQRRGKEENEWWFGDVEVPAVEGLEGADL